jgi:hypothetical protein
VLLIELRDQRAILRVAGTCVNDDAKIRGFGEEVDGEGHDEFDHSGDTHPTDVP